MFDKMKGFFKTKAGKVGMCVSAVSVFMVPAALAVDETTTTSGLDITAVTTALKAGVSVADVLGLIAICVGIGLPFMLAWFGARKGIRVFQTAVKKGKISV